MNRQQTPGDKINEGREVTVKEKERETFYFHDSADMRVSVIVWLQLLVCRGGGGGWGGGLSASRNAT